MGRCRSLFAFFRHGSGLAYPSSRSLRRRSFAPPFSLNRSRSCHNPPTIFTVTCHHSPFADLRVLLVQPLVKVQFRGSNPVSSYAAGARSALSVSGIFSNIRLVMLRRRKQSRGSGRRLNLLATYSSPLLRSPYNLSRGKVRYRCPSGSTRGNFNCSKTFHFPFSPLAIPLFVSDILLGTPPFQSSNSCLLRGLLKIFQFASRANATSRSSVNSVSSSLDPQHNSS